MVLYDKWIALDVFLIALMSTVVSYYFTYNV